MAHELSCVGSFSPASREAFSQRVRGPRDVTLILGSLIARFAVVPRVPAPSICLCGEERMANGMASYAHDGGPRRIRIYCRASTLKLLFQCPRILRLDMQRTFYKPELQLMPSNGRPSANRVKTVLQRRSLSRLRVRRGTGANSDLIDQQEAQNPGRACRPSASSSASTKHAFRRDSVCSWRARPYRQQLNSMGEPRA